MRINFEPKHYIGKKKKKEKKKKKKKGGKSFVAPILAFHLHFIFASLFGAETHEHRVTSWPLSLETPLLLTSCGPQASHVVSLSFGFLFCKMGKTVT